MTQAATAVAILGSVGLLLFYMRSRTTKLIRNAKTTDDILRAAKADFTAGQSRLVEEWVTSHSIQDHSGLADQMSPNDWRLIEHAASAESPLRNIAKSRRLLTFRRVLKMAGDAAEVIRLSAANALLTDSMERAAAFRLKEIQERLREIQEPGPDYVWNWLELSQYAQYPAWSEALAMWKHEAAIGLRAWRHRDIVRFLSELTKRDYMAEPEWEITLVRRLNFAMLGGTDFEVVEVVAIVNNFDDLLKELYNEAALFELARRRESEA